MSTEKRYNLLSSYAEDLHASTLNLKGMPASLENATNVKFIYESWVYLLGDLMRVSPTSQSGLTKISRFTAFLKKNDIAVVLDICKKGYELLIENIRVRNRMSLKSFKAILSGIGGDETGFFLSPIIEDLLVVLQSSFSINNGCYTATDKESVVRVAQFFSLPLKVNLTGMGLEEAAVANYIEFERSILPINGSSTSNFLLERLECIVTTWMKDFQYSGDDHSHGPGSTASLRHACAYTKYHDIRVDSKIRIKCKIGQDGDNFTPFLPIVAFNENPELQRTSQLEFVPKNAHKLRSISMEPTTLQFLQQGIQRALEAYFRTHPFLSKIIKLHDQTQNRSYAYDASITDLLATLDLSNASDSVQYTFIKRIFRGTPRLLSWMIATRSSHTLLPNGVELPLKKFAPMGSSLCFPIETLVFAALTQLAYELSCAAGRMSFCVDLQTHSVYSDRHLYSIYGDDIIVRKEATKSLRNLLRWAGFQLNNDKSFLDSCFKESCGGNYYCGRDITAIKLKSIYGVDGDFCSKTYESLCAYANNAYAHGYPLLRYSFIRRIEKAGYVPLFTDRLGKDPMIFSLAPTNFKARQKTIKVPGTSFTRSVFKINRSVVVPDEAFSQKYLKNAPRHRAKLSQLKHIDDIRYILTLQFLARRKPIKNIMVDHVHKPYTIISERLHVEFAEPIRISYLSLIRTTNQIGATWIDNP